MLRRLTSPVGFYTHSLALIADAFHYVCLQWATTCIQND